MMRLLSLMTSTGLVRAVGVVMVIAGIWLVVGFLLRLPVAASSPRVAAETDPTRVAHTLAASSLFGVSATVDATPTVGKPSAEGGDYSLVGVVASPRGRGYALLHKTGDAAAIVAQLGREIEPGVMVRYVSANEISIGDARLALPEKSQTGAPGVNAPNMSGNINSNANNFTPNSNANPSFNANSNSNANPNSGVHLINDTNPNTNSNPSSNSNVPVKSNVAQPTVIKSQRARPEFAVSTPPPPVPPSNPNATPL